MEWLLALVGLGLLAAIWGIGIERHLYTVRKTEIAGVLPAGSKPIRVLHVSDFHLAPWQKRKQRFIAELANLNPDLVVNTGDNLGHRDSVDPLVESLTPLMRYPGVFAHGSNDYEAPSLRNPLSYLLHPSKPQHGHPLDTDRMTSEFEAAGWLNLNNKGGELEVSGLRIGFIGLDDGHDGKDDVSSIPAQVRSQTAIDLRIAVTHAPYLRFIELFTEADASVIFAGHTHGGQVCLPGNRALVTNCDLPTRYARGLSAWSFGGKNSILNVCAGLGTSIFAPVRLFCRPEVRLVTLLP
jgi:predicted MPP superfamily phosphohydrolase